MALTDTSKSLNDILTQFNVRPNSANCDNCGKLYPWDEYKFDFGYLIISAKMHECGEKYRTKKLKPFSDKEKQAWAEIAKKL